MPNSSEFNQFRRLIGDMTTKAVSEEDITIALNDATLELTRDFATPLTSFDGMVGQYHPEIIYKAAINWWWDKLGQLQDKHSTSIGQASQSVSEKWDRAYQMIQWLETQYDEIQSLKVDITIGNYSRFSKLSLRRIGGIREEDTGAL